MSDPICACGHVFRVHSLHRSFFSGRGSKMKVVRYAGPCQHPSVCGCPGYKEARG